MATPPPVMRFNLWLLLGVTLAALTLTQRLDSPTSGFFSGPPPPTRATAANASITDLLVPAEVPAIDSEAAALLWVFEQVGYHWPLQTPVQLPQYQLERLPNDLKTLDSSTRKSLFFRLLSPLIVAENQSIAATRNWLVNTFIGGRISASSRDGQTVQALFSDYSVSGDINDPAARTELLRRVDTLPPGLMLAQAALESGWGGSRFSRKGNNLFGIWTWDGEGLVPFNRPSGATHRVKTYDNLRGSIRHYLQTLNTGKAYRRLRQIRAYQRLAQQPLDPSLLAGGLEYYSARGTRYVDDIRRVIRNDQLQRLPQRSSWVRPRGMVGCNGQTDLTLPPASCD
ncbi:MAG: glucosaminidase domain-containing protein [Gammaproteobacteria bacterium]|nr:glucosaminidase domain-containing protein [Gammaproteobacteria bacterium]